MISLVLCIGALFGCAQTQPQATDTSSDTSADSTQQEPPETDTPSFIETITPSSGKYVKIAFIGDSITQGTGATNQKSKSYPAQFQNYVGYDYLVGNFGKAASYVLPYESPYNQKDKKELSYKNTQQYADSIAFKPDVVIITLGVNDIASMFSEAAKNAVVDALVDLGKTYEALESVQKVYIASSIRIFSSSRAETFSIEELPALQKKAAEIGGFGFLDIHAITYEYLDTMMHYTKDRLHPTDELYKVMARAYKAALFEEADYKAPSPQKSETGVVYLSAQGSDFADGKTQKTAVKNIANAVSLLRESGGTVVICSPVSLTYETHLPKTDKPITVTSKYNGTDYAASGASLDLAYNLYLNGSYTFENMKFTSSTSSSVGIYANFNDLTMGEGVLCSSQNTVIFAGRNAVSGIDKKYLSSSAPVTVTVKSGAWSAVIGGNNRTNAGCVLGDVSNVTVNIEGGKFTSGTGHATSAVGMNNVVGTCTMNISGGEFSSFVCAVIKGAYTASPTVSGNVDLNITGGVFSSTIKKNQDTLTKITGKVTVTLPASLKDKAVGFGENVIVK